MNNRFEKAMTAVILANAAVLAAATYTDQYNEVFAAANTAFLAVYIAEAVVRYRLAGTKQYLRDKWNLLDLGVIAVALVPGAGAIQALRLVRLAKLVRHLPEMRMALAAAAKAARSLAGLMGGMLLLMFGYALAGVGMFPNDPHFENVGDGMLFLFSMTTLENYPDTLDAAVGVGKLYWVSYGVLAGFLFINLITGVMVSAMEGAREAEKVDA